jgi:hypothetical protein
VVEAMSISSVGGASSAVSWTVPAAGVQAADPEVQREQVAAQADMLQALMGVKHTGAVAARVSDGTGVDVYL